MMRMARASGRILLASALQCLPAQPTRSQVAQKIPRIGVLHAGDDIPNAPISGFRTGLNDLGYRQGETIHIEYRWRGDG